MSSVEPVRRRPRMTDVAALAGVSHQTVSRVINDAEGVRPETRERVMAAIEELGYRRNMAARMLASTRSRLIGVVSWGSGLYGPASVVTGVEEAARARGFDLAVVTLRNLDDATIAAAVDRLLSQAVEALVFVVPHRATMRSTSREHIGVPVVTVLGDHRGTPMTAAIDNVGGARSAVAHLLSLGHRTVFHVAGPADFYEARAREKGWRTELQAAGVEVPPLRWGGDWSAASGYYTGLSLAREQDVTAVFAANDQMALGVIRAFVEHGRPVPDEVSVVGFDDIPESGFYSPPLTTVRQHFDVLAGNVMVLVERALDGEKAPRLPLVPTHLELRASTAPPATR